LGEEEVVEEPGVAIQIVSGNAGATEAVSVPPTSQVVSSEQQEGQQSEESLKQRSQHLQPPAAHEAFDHEQYQSLTKLQQYYVWMNSLHRANYRNPANATGIIQQQEGEDATQAVCEVAAIFQSYGLTPQDLNIPWQFDKQIQSLRRGYNPLPFALQTYYLSPRRSSSSPKRETQRRATVTTLDAKSISNAYRVGLQSYNPSSWREDITIKKAQESTGVSRPTSSSTIACADTLLALVACLSLLTY
jgi:hypothetical protein